MGGDGDLWGGMGMYGDSGHSVASRSIMTFMHSSRWCECGLENTANTAKESFEDAVKRVFGDEGFQCAFEVSGVQKCITDLVANIEKGSDIVIVAVFSKNPEVNLAVLDEHEIRLIGSMMYLHEDYLLAFPMVPAPVTITFLPLTSVRPEACMPTAQGSIMAICS